MIEKIVYIIFTITYSQNFLAAPSRLALKLPGKTTNTLKAMSFGRHISPYILLAWCSSFEPGIPGTVD